MNVIFMHRMHEYDIHMIAMTSLWYSEARSVSVELCFVQTG